MVNPGRKVDLVIPLLSPPHVAPPSHKKRPPPSATNHLSQRWRLCLKSRAKHFHLWNVRRSSTWQWNDETGIALEGNLHRKALSSQMPEYQWIMPRVIQAGICKAEELDVMMQGRSGESERRGGIWYLVASWRCWSQMQCHACNAKTANSTRAITTWPARPESKKSVVGGGCRCLV